MAPAGEGVWAGVPPPPNVLASHIRADAVFDGAVEETRP
jgi:hypothetical protein